MKYILLSKIAIIFWVILIPFLGYQWGEITTNSIHNEICDKYGNNILEHLCNLDRIHKLDKFIDINNYCMELNGYISAEYYENGFVKKIECLVLDPKLDT